MSRIRYVAANPHVGPPVRWAGRSPTAAAEVCARVCQLGQSDSEHAIPILIDLIQSKSTQQGAAQCWRKSRAWLDVALRFQRLWPTTQRHNHRTWRCCRRDKVNNARHKASQVANSDTSEHPVRRNPTRRRPPVNRLACPSVEQNLCFEIVIS